MLPWVLQKMFRLPAWWWTRVSAIQLVSSEFLRDFAETFGCQNNEQRELKEFTLHLQAITMISFEKCKFQLLVNMSVTLQIP